MPSCFILQFRKWALPPPALQLGTKGKQVPQGQAAAGGKGSWMQCQCIRSGSAKLTEVSHFACAAQRCL